MLQQRSLSGRNKLEFDIFNIVLNTDLINRLVNMLDMTELDQEKVWEIVKKTRITFLSEYSIADCKILLSDRNIQKNINSLAEDLNLNTTSIPNKFVSDTSLQSAGEMFTYLNYCPLIIPKYALLSAYLFKTGTPREIILALTSAIKTSQNVDEKNNLIKSFLKVMEILGLNHYEKFQILTKGKCYTNKAIFENCTLKTNVTSKEDDKLKEGHFNHFL